MQSHRSTFVSPAIGALPFATIANSLQISARSRRGGVLVSVAAAHVLVLWALANLSPSTRNALPTFMQVMLIPEPPARVIAPPVPVVALAMPILKADFPPPVPLPKIEIAQESSTPPQPLITLAAERKPDAMTSALNAAPEPSSPPAPAAVAPATAAAAAAVPVAVRAAAAAARPVDIPPSAIQYLQLPDVVYPALSRRRREIGLVIVSTLVDTDGRVVQTQIFQSSGFERLDDAAIAAVRKARFKPYMQSGQAATGWARIPIRFELDN